MVFPSETLVTILEEIKRRNKIHGLIVDTGDTETPKDKSTTRRIMQRKLQVRITKPVGWYRDEVGECFWVADIGDVEDFYLWEDIMNEGTACSVIGREDCVILAQQTAKI